MTRSTLSPTQILQEAYDEPNQALRVTGDFAAEDHAHDGTYAPLSGNAVWLPGGSLTPGGGSAVTEFSSRAGAVFFDAAADERASISVGRPPVGWATYDVVAYWGNAGAGSGDVVWQLETVVVGDNGDTLSGGTTVVGTVTDGAPGQNKVTWVTLASGLAITADRFYSLRVTRVGTNVADTLANDAALLGLRLVRAS